jgi:OmpA-OmpF porin, OOP family
MRKGRTFSGFGYLALLMGLAVSGCSPWSYSPPIHGIPTSADSNLAAAKAAAPQNPSSFVQYLAVEYVALADNLSQLGDSVDVDYFARKAQMAEQGEVVPPENNANWAVPLEVPYSFRTQLTQARTRLVAALDGGARDRAPQLAARAQARLDCWMERMEDDWQHAQNGPCRSEFLAAMDQLEGHPAAPPPAAARSTELINVYFDFNKSSLTREGRQIVQQVAAQVKGDAAMQVMVTGKTDLAGTDSYNMALSRRRAEAVRSELMKDGVAAGQIKLQWTGMREPPVKTAQGVREPRNRVVEISLH